MPTVRRLSAALTILTTAAAGLLGVAEPAHAAGFAVQDLTLSASQVDVTTSGQVTIKARLVDDVPVEIADVSLAYQPDAANNQGDKAADRGFTGGLLTRVSGTGTDGWWQVTLPLPAGTRGAFTIQVGGIVTGGAEVGFSAQQLAAAGLPDRVRTTTTAVPGALVTKPTGGTRGANCGIYITLPCAVGYINVSLPTKPGTPAARAVELVSASPSCWKSVTYPFYVVSSFSGVGRTVGICTVKYRPVNAFGAGPTSTVTFL